MDTVPTYWHNTQKKIVAVDKDKKTIQQAKQKYDLPNLDFYIQDVSQLHKYFPYTFDVVCCFHLIEYLRTPEYFLEEVAKRLVHPYSSASHFNTESIFSTSGVYKSPIALSRMRIQRQRVPKSSFNAF